MNSSRKYERESLLYVFPRINLIIFFQFLLYGFCQECNKRFVHNPRVASNIIDSGLPILNPGFIRSEYTTLEIGKEKLAGGDKVAEERSKSAGSCSVSNTLVSVCSEFGRTLRSCDVLMGEPYDSITLLNIFHDLKGVSR